MVAFRLLLPVLVLGACNAADPRDGLNRSGTASAGGHTFRVNSNLETAQATRTNATWRPAMASVLPAALAATEQVTGCRVKPETATGDVALIEVALDCTTRR